MCCNSIIEELYNEFKKLTEFKKLIGDFAKNDYYSAPENRFFSRQLFSRQLFGRQKSRKLSR